MDDVGRSSEFDQPSDPMELDEPGLQAERDRNILAGRICSIKNIIRKIRQSYGLIIEMKVLLRSFDVFTDAAISQACSHFTNGASKDLHCQPCPPGMEHIIKLLDPTGNKLWFHMVKNQLNWAIHQRVASLMDKSRSDLVQLLNTVEKTPELWLMIDLDWIESKLQDLGKKDQDIVMTYMGKRRMDQRILLKEFVLVLDASLESTAIEWDRISQSTGRPDRHQLRYRETPKSFFRHRPKLNGSQ